MMNLIVLLIVTLLAFALLRVASVFKNELAWALGGFGYNPGGLTVPVGYHLPTVPYLPLAASVSASWWTFVTGTSATFNGKTFTLRRAEADGSFTSVQFTYYNTGGGPSLPIIGINVTGLTTAQQIRQVTATRLNFAGFVATTGATASMRVEQPFPGTQADIGFAGDFSAGTAILFTKFGYQEPITLAVYGNSLFFGMELSAPALIGRTRGMVPVATAAFNGGN